MDFTTPPTVGVVVRLQRKNILDREVDYIQGGQIKAETMDLQFDTLTQMNQDLNREAFKENSSGDLDAATRKLVNLGDPENPQDAVSKNWAETVGTGFAGDAAASAAAALVSENNASTSEGNAGADVLLTNADVVTTNADVLLTNADVVTTNADVLLTNADVVTTNADAASTAADKLATNADVVTTNADAASTNTDATNAAASAATAQTAANSLIGNDVVFKTFADSPINLAEADRGKLYVIDTSGGAVVVNLPTIATVTMPFIVGVKKSTGDANSVTVNRTGTDTIDNGLTTLATAILDGGWTFVGDTDPNPDAWTTLPASNIVTSVAGKVGDVTLDVADVANALDKTGDTMTGLLELSSTQPILKFSETDRSVDYKNWYVLASFSKLKFQAVADAGGSGGNYFQFGRAGNELNNLQGVNSNITWFVVDNLNKKITTDTAPTNPEDLTRKGYVDTVATQVAAPATATSIGTTGNIAFDTSYFYVCTATNTWKRAAIAAW